ncbi:MAG: bifunctional glutamate N-acetyltransferase/amino-acid acetyltransferase ArgJ [Gorillibacterium sp.]|nr:bifunctional glutamate N-acetyltransferase/amino-acid acetyltransferase ArgJ [Gorillibacterium sp.]
MSITFEIIPEGNVTSPKGFQAGGLHCGLKKTQRRDLGLLYCEVPAAAAAVYTLNVFQAAPLKVTRESLGAGGRLQALVVNSGNANACTGVQGEADARAMRQAVAAMLGIAEPLVGVASTGVIGELLPMEKVQRGINGLSAVLSPAGGNDFCEAILTTDLIQKSICVQVETADGPVRIAGAAKGSGMIHPNMATMLGFITSDAKVDSEGLQSLLSAVTDSTFNMITVDGDTSTNDMVVAMASGLSGSAELKPGHPDWQAFRGAFEYVAEYLAKAIARDGEGATKLVEVQVAGAVDEATARAIAKTVVGSSLVKTACFGADANWGRIVAAVGRSGQPVNPDTVDVSIGDYLVLQQSRPVPFDDPAATEYLKGHEVTLFINLHMGEARATAWGCDLTYEYVRINAAYRT